jgi:adenylosuccinate lyase
MAFTHLQPAEPSTLGYRLALYAQDLWEDRFALATCRADVRGKGFGGAVGTRASYADLIGAAALDGFQAKIAARLDLEFYPVTGQTYPRKQDYRVMCALAGLGASLYKFAFDLRVLQSPPVGEWAEPFGKSQVGSSAMPFKRNPINAEKMDSLARLLAGFPRLAWENAAHSLLERTLDDSANRRVMLPEAFLIAAELLAAARKILGGLVINEAAVERNLATYAPFAATERVLMALARAGADRQEMHERLRVLSMQAWEQVQLGQSNPFAALLQSDALVAEYLQPEQIRSLLEVHSHTGDASQRALALARQIRSELVNTPQPGQ